MFFSMGRLVAPVRWKRFRYFPRRVRFKLYCEVFLIPHLTTRSCKTTCSATPAGICFENKLPPHHTREGCAIYAHNVARSIAMTKKTVALDSLMGFAFTFIVFIDFPCIYLTTGCRIMCLSVRLPTLTNFRLSAVVKFHVLDFEPVTILRY